jgi:hypothetical protein
VCHLPMLGMGQPSPPPPIAGCYQVFIGSDSEGMFGHQCPKCGVYWRSDCFARFCPYCGLRGEITDFLSLAQRRYVAKCCAKMTEAITSERNGDYIIDMDAVADAVGKNTEKPDFYYAEESQQNRFTCKACGSFNDILGTFGYCAICGTRNDLQELSDKIIPKLRERIKSEGSYESCVRDCVAAFDSLVGQYVGQLVQHVRMSPGRRNRLVGRTFQHLESVANDLREIFDIDIFARIKEEDSEFAKLMFHRRHVYEHKGGEADEKYISDSGDTAVRPKQALRVTLESAHRIAGIVVRMSENLHAGFHGILPPDEASIDRFRRNSPNRPTAK